MVDAATVVYQGEAWSAVTGSGPSLPALVARMSADVAAALADPAVQARLAPLGADYRASSPEAMAALVQEEVERWGPVIRDARISAT